MSVRAHAPEIVPDWSRHDLAHQYRAIVRAQAKRVGLSHDEADEEGERQALRLCFEGPATDEELKMRFITRTKYGLIHRREELLFERPISDFAQDEGDSNGATDRLHGVFFGKTQPVQEDATFIRECMRFLDKLPPNHRRVMRKVAIGYSALDIANEEHADLSAVLLEIRTARDWLQDHVKWGE